MRSIKKVFEKIGKALHRRGLQYQKNFYHGSVIYKKLITDTYLMKIIIICYKVTSKKQYRFCRNFDLRKNACFSLIFYLCFYYKISTGHIF